MSEQRSPQNLPAECALLYGYLVGRQPSSYVVEKYCVAHHYVAALEEPAGSFDRFLLRAALLHPLLLRLVQAYARIFAPTALARKKAVLMLAIVECSAPAHAVTQRARPQSRIGALTAACFATALFGFELLLGALLLAPIHVVAAAIARARRPRATQDLVVHEAT